MGPIEKNLIAQAKRFKQPIPDRIRNKPKLGFGLDFYLSAFFDLEYERQWVNEGAIALPITWTSLQNYAQHHDLEGDAHEDFMFFMAALDTAYLKHLAKKGG